MINLGIIGTGFGAKIHVPGFRAIRGARILGIAGNSALKTERIAKDLDISLAFSSWKELVRHPQIDAVSIAAPPPFQKEMALYSAKFGKHIFCEKPLGMSAREAKAMLRAAKSARVAHMIDFEFRNIPGIKLLASLLAKKTVGHVRHVNISWLTGGRASMDIPLGWRNKVDAGGGILFSHGAHVVDYIEMLFGHTKSVSARLNIAKKNGATAEDSCDMLFELGNGATANVSISNVLPNARGHAIEVYGDKASLILENTDLNDFAYSFKLFHFPAGTRRRLEIPIAVPAPARKHADARLPLFVETAKEFINAVRRGHSGSPSFADGLRAQTVLDAIRKSARSKKTVLV